jgi:hypothetical protein
MTIAFPKDGGAPIFRDVKQVYDVTRNGFHHFALSDPSRKGDRYLVVQKAGFEGVGDGRKLVLNQNWLQEFEDHAQ